jgi:DNA-binding GntR family transcriptional regulator
MKESEPTGQRRLPTRPSLVEDVYDLIVEVLISNEVEPGQPFNIEAFAREIDVSPTPIREALTRSEAEGLVVRLPSKGFIAAPLLTTDQFRQVTQVRRLLEPWAASRCAEIATPEDAERLYDLARAVVPSDHALAYRADMQRDAAFHDAIWGLAGNTFVRDSLRRLHCHLHMYRIGYTKELRHVSETEHLEISNSIAVGDVQVASRAMLAHIDVAADRVERRTSIGAR